jgi:hypothetical protein
MRLAALRLLTSIVLPSLSRAQEVPVAIARAESLIRFVDAVIWGLPLAGESGSAGVLVNHRLHPRNIKLFPKLDSPHARFTQ